MKPPPRTEVVVTGLGVVTPLGDDPDVLWDNLLAGRCGTRSWPDLEAEGFRNTVAARIDNHSEHEHRRGLRLGVAAARGALAHCGLDPIGPVGVFVGTTMGESAAYELAAAGGAFDLERSAASAFPHGVRDALGVNGPVRAYATACAAGNYAIGAGAAAVASGRLQAAICGGIEPFSRIAMVGFTRSRAMATERCRPFDRKRNGMLLGEAAAFLVLERRDDARARNAHALAVVSSLGLTCDGYHATAPRPDGTGMADAMSAAMDAGVVSREDIGWICAHGSGTVASDLAEARALHHVFGTQPPPVTGIKGALGHSMGAASAVEAVVTALALERGVLPPTVGIEEPDPECSLDIVREPRIAQGMNWALNCAYAFGGVNSALLMGSA